MNRRARRPHRGHQRRAVRYAHAWGTVEPGSWCLAIHPAGFVCSLYADHAGEHVALTADHVVAWTWPRNACRVALAAADPGQI